MSGDAAAASESKPSLLMGLIVPLLVLTLAAGGGGTLIGMQIVSAVRAPHAADPAVEPAKPPSTSLVKELAPIVANLASPDGAIVRLQTAIVYDRTNAPEMDVTAARINDDLLAYVKTLSLAQIQGASGFQHLREDLNERAVIRSDGHVREVMIETLVVQ